MSHTHTSQCSLADRKCVPCRGGQLPLEHARIVELLGELSGWEAVDDHHLNKTWKFADFAEALKFVNTVGATAERENHHPVIHFTWGRVTVETWTHKIDGLTESDFVLAAKIDAA